MWDWWYWFVCKPSEKMGQNRGMVIMISIIKIRSPRVWKSISEASLWRGMKCDSLSCFTFQVLVFKHPYSLLLLLLFVPHFFSFWYRKVGQNFFFLCDKPLERWRLQTHSKSRPISSYSQWLRPHKKLCCNKQLKVTSSLDIIFVVWTS